MKISAQLSRSFLTNLFHCGGLNLQVPAWLRHRSHGNEECANIAVTVTLTHRCTANEYYDDTEGRLPAEQLLTKNYCVLLYKWYSSV